MKQRLLGAAVLIALAIIFVPMFLSGSGPKQDSETVNLEIPPAPDREFETRVLPVESVRQDETRFPAVTAGEVEQVKMVDTNAPARVDARPEEVKPSPAPAVVSAPAPAKVVVAPVAEPVKTPTPAQTAAGAGGTGRFLVHLGVYSSPKNADDLVATLKRGGFPAFSETTDYQGKAAQRVRVGPFADRAQAEAARVRIKQIKSDVPGSVIALAGDVKADAPASAVPASKPGGWAVQLGAFKTEDDANKLRGRLQTAGFAGYVDKLAAEGQTLWRVRAGPETDRAGADRLRGRIKDKLKLDGMIVTQS